METQTNTETYKKSDVICTFENIFSANCRLFSSLMFHYKRVSVLRR